MVNDASIAFELEDSLPQQLNLYVASLLIQQELVQTDAEDWLSLCKPPPTILLASPIPPLDTILSM